MQELIIGAVVALVTIVSRGAFVFDDVPQKVNESKAVLVNKCLYATKCVWTVCVA